MKRMSKSVIILVMPVLLAASLSRSIAQDKGVGVQAKASTGRNWALVIGINGYANMPLQYCVRDAELLADTLRTKCGYPEDRVYLMSDGRKQFQDTPTRKNILKTARIIADLGRPAHAAIAPAGPMLLYPIWGRA